jgi:uncharacterized membrane protein YkvA (DUF1232 family)
MADLIRNLQLAFRLVQDNRVPTWVKVGIPLLVAIYILSPIDLIPDVLIGPGQVDDIAVIVLGVTLMTKLAPRHVVEEHQRAMGMIHDEPRTGESEEPESTIDGEYRVVPPK